MKTFLNFYKTKMKIDGKNYRINNVLYKSSNSCRIRNVYQIEDTNSHRKFILKEIRFNNDHFLCQKEEEISVIYEIKLLSWLKQTLTSEESEYFGLLCNYEIVKEKGTVYYLMFDYFTGMDLFEYANLESKLTEVERHSIFKDILFNIAKGLEILHQKMVAHRDLKLENIYLIEKTSPDNKDDQINLCTQTRYWPIIIDFNLSCCFNPDFWKQTGLLASSSWDLEQVSRKRLRYISGTKYYMSPETVLKQDNCFQNLLLTDIWSMGVLIYSFIFQRYPFSVSTCFQSLYSYNNESSRWRLQLMRNLTPFNNLIKDIFVPRNKRISISQIIDYLTKLNI